jgi:hypothetical protein
MTSAAEPTIIAEQGGLVIAEAGPHVLVIDRGAGPSQILAFVLLVITVVFGGFGAITTVMAAGDGAAAVPLGVGVVVLTIGAAAGAGVYFLARSLRRIRSAPLTRFAPVAVFDRQRRTYLDGAGRLVAPLDHVRFERRMQLGSSSPKLVAVTPTGTHDLKRGNPFGGGIGNLDAVLSAAVFGR